MAPLYPGVPFYHLKKQKESGERKERGEGHGGKAIQSSENVAKQD